MRKICIISLISHLLNYSFNIRSEINHHLVSVFPRRRKLLLYLPQARILGSRISLHLRHDPLSLVTKEFLLSIQPRYLAGARARLLTAGSGDSFQTRLDLLKIF